MWTEEGERENPKLLLTSELEVLSLCPTLEPSSRTRMYATIYDCGCIGIQCHCLRESAHGMGTRIPFRHDPPRGGVGDGSASAEGAWREGGVVVVCVNGMR